MRQCFLCGTQVDERVESIMIHESCIKKLFGVTYIPKISLSLKDIPISAQKMAGKLSFSGVQLKLSLKLNRETKELEVTPSGGEYILKPQTDAFQGLPQNENICMTIASCLGIDVPYHSLIKLQDQTWAYIVKRFDREKGEKIHQEDFCQILEKDEKYKCSVEEVGKKLKSISEQPGLDAELFFERVLFFFIIGNGDAHLKNFSMTYDENGAMRLSKAYDIVCSKLVIPSEEDMALSMNGKRNKIRANDFLAFADFLEIPRKISEGLFLDKEELILDLIKKGMLDPETKQRFLDIASERFARLKI